MARCPEDKENVDPDASHVVRRLRRVPLGLDPEEFDRSGSDTDNSEEEIDLQDLQDHPERHLDLGNIQVGEDGRYQLPIEIDLEAYGIHLPPPPPPLPPPPPPPSPSPPPPPPGAQAQLQKQQQVAGGEAEEANSGEEQDSEGDTSGEEEESFCDSECTQGGNSGGERTEVESSEEDQDSQDQPTTSKRRRKPDSTSWVSQSVAQYSPSSASDSKACSREAAVLSPSEATAWNTQAASSWPSQAEQFPSPDSTTRGGAEAAPDPDAGQAVEGWQSGGQTDSESEESEEEVEEREGEEGEEEDTEGEERITEQSAEGGGLPGQLNTISRHLFMHSFV